jgi:biotin operon repressor
MVEDGLIKKRRQHMTSDNFHFGGETFDHKLDGDRLRSQLERVRRFTTGHADYWYTLAEIAEELNYPEASISARLRDLRKRGYPVERRRVTGQRGLWEYRVGEQVIRD